MKEEKKIERCYQEDAQRIIDAMFDAKLFSEKATRDDMAGFEELIAFHFQSHHDMTKRSIELLNSLKHLK